MEDEGLGYAEVKSGTITSSSEGLWREGENISMDRNWFSGRSNCRFGRFQKGVLRDICCGYGSLDCLSWVHMKIEMRIHTG
jgi:hypothetical protein